MSRSLRSSTVPSTLDQTQETEFLKIRIWPLSPYPNPRWVRMASVVFQFTSNGDPSCVSRTAEQPFADTPIRSPRGSLSSIYANGEDVLQTMVFQLSDHLQPRLGRFNRGNPHAQRHVQRSERDRHSISGFDVGTICGSKESSRFEGTSDQALEIPVFSDKVFRLFVIR